MTADALDKLGHRYGKLPSEIIVRDDVLTSFDYEVMAKAAAVNE